MYIRGAENIMLDMAEKPAMAHALFGRIRGFYLEYLRRILEAAGGALDIVLTGDDFGAQNGPLISPGMWDRFLRQGFADYLALARSFGAVTMHHTCGSVVDLVPRMVDCGLQVLQSLQPEARGMDAAALKDAFGERLCFQGGVSIQRTLPYGTPDDVRREVQALAGAMGRGGGYIFCTSHNIQADTPMENVRALLDAYSEFGAMRTS
jgi:uroporphyrinogen decarboxylase